MPEATVLYSVTGVVIVGLVVWVAMVLAKAKEPWARPAPAEEPALVEDAPEPKIEAAASEKNEPVEASKDAPKLDADDTARATPVALSEGRTKAASETSELAKDDAKVEEKKDEEAKKAEA